MQLNAMLGLNPSKIVVLSPICLGTFLKSLNAKDTKAVLLPDNCAAQANISELKSDNIFVTYLPSNVTYLIQLMDQGLIKNLKCKYKRSFIPESVNSDCSVKDFQEKFNIKDAIFAAALPGKNDNLEKSGRNCGQMLWIAKTLTNLLKIIHLPKMMQTL